MEKQAFLGAAFKKASTAVFGSPEKSLASNAVKATGLAALTSTGIKPPSTSTLNQSGKGFTMTNETIGYITDTTTCNLASEEEEEITEEFRKIWD